MSISKEEKLWIPSKLIKLDLTRGNLPKILAIDMKKKTKNNPTGKI